MGSLFGLGLVCLLVQPAGAKTEATTRPIVTDAVQVTNDPNVVRAHTSPQLARNPKTGELVVVEGDIRGSRSCTVHISVDDGRSWSVGGTPLQAPDTDCSNHADWGPYATLAFDKDGVLSMAVEASDPALFDATRNDTPRDIFLARSPDSGRTWTTTQVLKAVLGDPNKGINKGATLAVDPKNPNNIYVGWRQGAFGSPAATEKLKTMVAASTDAGRTWSPAVDVTDERGGDFPWMTVTPDGTLHVVYWTRVFPAPPSGQPNPVRPIYEIASTDHGKTFGPRYVVDPGNQNHEHPPEVASDPKSGALYVVWAAQPDANNGVPGYAKDLEIYFRSSVDGGKTWTDKRTLNDDGPGKANQMEPGLSVAPNGRIDVAWYDGRNSPVPYSGDTELGFNDVYATYSTDGGITFAPNIRVTDRSSDRSVGVWANNVDQRLDVGIASSDDGTYYAWQDTRNANHDFQPEDVYMASVKLDGEPSPLGTTSHGTPAWLAMGAGAAIGLGVAMVAVWARGWATSPAPSGAGAARPVST
ncbi:MAG TPA: sialidase family protein [Acidimicrobiales bacterium]|nr:sialidase family protein [Acidimicrobiales bacterium]